MRTLSLSACLAALILIAALVPSHAAAQVLNGGSIVAMYPAGLRLPVLTVPQPDSGALIVLADTRNGTVDYYVQKVDRHGHRLFGAVGNLVISLASGTYLDAVLPDGAGGAVFSRTVNRGATGLDIVLQRIMPDGSLGYGPSGIVVCNAPFDQQSSQLLPGPSGTYYVVWNDNRANLSSTDIYAQRVTAAGSFMWAANGIAVDPIASSTSGGVYGLVPDLQGGFITYWYPYSGSGNIAQRVNSSGVLQWGANGVPFGNGSDGIGSIGGDGTGGVWGVSQHWDGTYITSAAHHLLSNGTSAFAPAGIEFYPQIYQGSLSTQIYRNGTGGCLIFGMVYSQPSRPVNPLFIQEISAAGTVLRGSYGQTIGNQLSFPVFTDAGDAILMSLTDAELLSGRPLLRAQRFGFDGTPFYPGNGLLLGRGEPQSVVITPTLSKLANGLLFAAWADSRYTTPSKPANYQAFGQAYTTTGAPLWDDSELPTLQSAKDAAADQGGFVRTTWGASIADNVASAMARGYRVWRSLADGTAALPASARPTTEGIFHANGRTLLFKANTFWEQAGEQSAATLPTYAMTVPTMQDSMAGSPANQGFMVEAYDDSSHHWFSNVFTAHSVDNLAPSPIGSATGFFAGGSTSLYWSGVPDGDLCCFDVFRGSSPGFVPADANKVATTTQLSLVDPFGAPSYYRIAARDIHGNLGPSILVMPAGTLAVDDGAPKAWALRSAWSATHRALELTLDLPQSDSGRLELFDVTGRRLWSEEYRAGAASSLAFHVAPSSGMPPGLVYARARSEAGKIMVAKAIVLE